MSAVTNSGMTSAADRNVVFSRLNRVIRTVDECIPDRLETGSGPLMTMD